LKLFQKWGVEGIKKNDEGKNNSKIFTMNSEKNPT
jgi:hypothetical protein